MSIKPSITGSDKYYSTSFNITGASVEFITATPPTLDEDGYHVITLSPEDLDTLIGVMIAAKRNIGPRSDRLIKHLIKARNLDAVTESNS